MPQTTDPNPTADRVARAHTLRPSARALLTPDFRQGLTGAHLEDHIQQVPDGRSLPVEDLCRLLDTARERYAEQRTASDRWLAPRVHALLRLDRREAADRFMWAWLAAVHCAPYVLWRFPGKTAEEEEDRLKRGTNINRFFGQDRDNALSRLWWGGELCRDGGDYTPVEQAFINQDVPSTWFSLNAFHHPACAQAALRLLPRMSGKPAVALAKGLDHVLTTIQLDVVAPTPAPDAQAIIDWREDPLELEQLLEDLLPAGPPEEPIDPAAIHAVEALLRRVARELQPPLELPA